MKCQRFPLKIIYMIPSSSEKISWKYIYRKLYYNRDIRTTLRHFWIVSGWQRYFWISVPLTHHYKKCPVMWTIIGLIGKNPEISLSSRNNPEMSQRSNRGLSNEPVSSYIKSFTEELHMRPYMVTKRRCDWNKTFLLGPIAWNKVISCFISSLFIMFLCTWNAHYFQ